MLIKDVVLQSNNFKKKLTELNIFQNEFLIYKTLECSRYQYIRILVKYLKCGERHLNIMILCRCSLYIHDFYKRETLLQKYVAKSASFWSNCCVILHLLLPNLIIFCTLSKNISENWNWKLILISYSYSSSQNLLKQI